MTRFLPFACAALVALWAAGPALAATARAVASVTIVGSVVGIEAPERGERAPLRVFGTSAYDVRVTRTEVLVEFN